MDKTTEQRENVRIVISVILTVIAAVLLLVCVITCGFELLSESELGRLAQPHDIDYTDLVLNFGLLALYVFAGIILSAVVIRLDSDRRLSVCCRIFTIVFALMPCVLLFA